jgi:hypothetical protein
MSKTKMTAKQAFEKMKGIFLSFTTEGAAGDTGAADEVKEYTSDSGAVYKIDKLEAGGKVLTEDGKTPAPEGTITLSDATIIMVDASGVITSVQAPATVDAPPTEEAMQAMFAKFAEGTPEDRIGNLETMCKALMQYNFQWKINEQTRGAIEAQAIEAFRKLATPQAFKDQFKAQFSEQESKFNALQEAYKADVQKFTTAIGSFVQLMEAFADEPGADPIQAPPDKGPALSKTERAKKIAENMKKAKEAL